METLFFILGIASVVVIATAIVAVVSIVKVTKLQKRVSEEGSGFQHTIEDLYRLIDFNERERSTSNGRNHEEVHRRIDNTQQELQSQLDSRLDKLANKTDKSFEELHKVFNDYINNNKK